MSNLRTESFDKLSISLTRVLLLEQSGSTYHDIEKDTLNTTEVKSSNLLTLDKSKNQVTVEEAA